MHLSQFRIFSRKLTFFLGGMALNSSLLKPVTKRTVRNYLTKLGFEYKMKLKQWLSKKQLFGVGNIVIELSMTGVTLFSVMSQHFMS